ncbi:MAG: DUF1080 domain-containing protein [Bryobacterales bacterium]
MRFALAFLVAACSLSAQSNTLTEDEIRDGWILLWDGKTDFGWEYHGDADWTMRDGVLAARSGQNGWLGTTTAFGDFHLRIDFRCAADGNSGVFLRSAREGQPHRTGYELQIYDDQPQGFNTGSLVFYDKAEPAKLIPDVWNHYEVLVEGMHFQAILNGKIVLDAYNPTHLSGVIGLQYNENKPIEFRNIKLRPLNLEPLFDGRDLSGWREVDRPNNPGNDRWSVRDGDIHVEGGPGQLESEKQFRNLALQLGIKTNPASPDAHPNSGVFFRGVPGQFWSGYEIQIRNEHDGNITNPVDFGTGGVYFFQRARGIVAADGEWFYETIMAYDRHISVWVNGVQVSDYEDVKPEGSNHRKQALLRSGTISLQAHDPTTNLDFRDIRAAEIAERPMCCR